MGKFFLGGAFLGAAVTWAIMHFLVPKGMDAKEVKDKVEAARTQVKDTVTREKDAEWKAKLGETTTRLKADLDSVRTAGTEEIKTLKAAGSKLERDLLEVGPRLTRLEAENKDLKERLERHDQKVAKEFAAARKLLEMRVALVEPQKRLWRTLGEVVSVLAQAEKGWPNVELARSKGKELSKLAAEYRKVAQAARAFIQQNSAELASDLHLDTKKLDRYRTGTETEYLDAIDKLIEKINAGVASLKLASVTVHADSDRWTGANVVVKEGDVLQVRAEGIWSMQESWAPAGPEGWDGGSPMKLTHRARVGSLILRIAVSESIHPAYLGKPIRAEVTGRVVLRMNDKDVSENAGTAAVQIVAANPRALKGAIAAWQKMTGGK